MKFRITTEATVWTDIEIEAETFHFAVEHAKTLVVEDFVRPLLGKHRATMAITRIERRYGKEA